MAESKETYFACSFIDGYVEEFDKQCNLVSEYSKDMISFKYKNHTTGDEVLLQIVAKARISHITNVGSKSIVDEIQDRASKLNKLRSEQDYL